MMTDIDLAYLEGHEMAAAFRDAELSPVEVHDAVQRLIDAREPFVNAVTDRNLGESRACALRSQERWGRSEPLHEFDGVPITFKENIARAGVPMSAGCAGVEPQLPARSAPSVLRAEQAGLVIVASTTMPDWGMLSSGISSRSGITRSPLCLEWTTGGSSSGAGAAAAAGYGPFHVGTDIGGSIRLPGTWLGLLALKPTAGRIALQKPYLGRAAGPLTRTARDAAVVMDILSGPDQADVSSLASEEIGWADTQVDVATLRIGLMTDAGCGGPSSPEVTAQVERAALAFQAAGADVIRVDPFMDQDLLDALDQFWRVRSWVDFRALDQSARNRVLPYVAAWCTGGADVSGARVMECYQSILEIQRRTVLATEAFDLVLSPVAPVAAFAAETPMPFEGDHATMHHIGFTAPFNMSGQPAASVNCGHTSDGRTVGLQIAGRRGDDLLVLKAAAWFERVREPADRPRWPDETVIPPAWESNVRERQRGAR